MGSGYAFQDQGWKQRNFLLCDLQEVVRQSDQSMIDALQRIRFGDYTASTFEDDEPVELSGTCGMRIENLENLDNEEAAEAEKILEKALKDSESYDYGYQTVIIAGDRYEYGSDEDEIIVENAEVIGIV